MSKIPTYNEENIPRLSPMEHVRLRPGMYFGYTDHRVVYQMMWEILGNSVEQAHRGFCDRIKVTLEDNYRISIEDNGTGIPVEIYKDTGRPILEIVMTEFGHQYSDLRQNIFNGGVTGVGLAAVNAMSETCLVGTGQA